MIYRYLLNTLLFACMLNISLGEVLHGRWLYIQDATKYHHCTTNRIINSKYATPMIPWARWDWDDSGGTYPISCTADNQEDFAMSLAVRMDGWFSNQSTFNLSIKKNRSEAHKIHLCTLKGQQVILCHLYCDLHRLSEDDLFIRIQDYPC